MDAGQLAKRSADQEKQRFGLAHETDRSIGGTVAPSVFWDHPLPTSPIHTVTHTFAQPCMPPDSDSANAIDLTATFTSLLTHISLATPLLHSAVDGPPQPTSSAANPPTLFHKAFPCVPSSLQPTAFLLSSMMFLQFYLTCILLLAFCSLLPTSRAVPWMVCASTTCSNRSLCLSGNVAVDQHAAVGGKVSSCFQVPGANSWFATIACSSTSGVTSYNFFVSNSSSCTLAYTTHAWSGQDGQCVEGTDLTYYAQVDCSAASATATAGAIILASALLSILSMLALS